MQTFLILASGTIGWACFCLFSLLTGIVAVPAQLLALPFDRFRRVGSAVMRSVWCVWQFRLQPFWNLSWEGLERVGPGPYVIVANHQSMIDIVTCITLPVEVKVMARAGIFRIPFIGWFMSLIREIRVAPDDRDAIEETYRYSLELLSQGISVVVFPEGSRSTDGQVHTFYKGAFRIAKDAGVAVLPIVIDGSTQIMRKGRTWPSAFPARVRARVLEPIEVDEVGSAKKLTRMTRERIVEGLAQLRLA